MLKSLTHSADDYLVNFIKSIQRISHFALTETDILMFENHVFIF